MERDQIKIINNRKKAREIVKEIVNFGVNDEQIIHIIYLLSLNLEDNEKMSKISQTIKKIEESINAEQEDDNIVNASPKKIILE
jgi:hypothetical protein|tara:strand:- start:743 stop:994 length:252 start_codon:yes stop_codon:yes gene_type:complete